ncbi:hypothetical protein M405DRAFT_811660 [Rhizopogon salebrosus TDB-379]|nr:hypothetical protein M405DRAFT_811660 [Rhizopogon salebrosus TDB-379]
MAALEELEQYSADEVFDMLDRERELDETVDSELEDMQTTYDTHEEDLLATKVVDQYSSPTTRGKLIHPAHVYRRRYR